MLVDNHRKFVLYQKANTLSRDKVFPFLIEWNKLKKKHNMMMNSNDETLVELGLFHFLSSKESITSVPPISLQEQQKGTILNERRSKRIQRIQSATLAEFHAKLAKINTPKAVSNRFNSIGSYPSILICEFNI